MEKNRLAVRTAVAYGCFKQTFERLMPPILEASSTQDTRCRLIQAAGEIFAEHGFHKASVRQITEKAGVNVAAINYHFRDKAELYASCLRQCRAPDEETIAFDPSAPPEVRLRAYVDRLVLRLLNPNRPRWHHLLMAREMAEPTAMLDQLVTEDIQPEVRELEATVNELTGGKLTRDRVMMQCFSVISQCLSYLTHRAIQERLYPKFKTKPPTPARIAEHVFAFSLAGIRAAADENL